MTDDNKNEPVKRGVSVKDRSADIGPFATYDEKNLPAIHGSSDTRESAQEIIDQKISITSDPKDLRQLITLRGTVIEQDEKQKDRKHARRVSNRKFWFEGFLKVGAVIAGLMVMYTFNAFLGTFILGIGLYALAPALIKQFFSTKSENGDDNDS